MPKNRRFFNIAPSTTNEVDIFIYGPIGYGDWFEDSRDGLEFVKEFKALEEKYDTINIRINSAGGVIDEGLPIFNVIRNSEKKTVAWIDGIAYSMAAIIALAADEVHAMKNSLLLIHNASGIEWGNAKDMRDMANFLDKYDSSLITAITDKTGMTETEAREKLFNYEDHIFTAVEALEEKLIDKIEDKTADLPKNIKNMDMKEVMAYLAKLNDQEKEERFIDKIVNRVKNTFSKEKETENKSDITMEQLKQLAEAAGLQPEATFDEILAAVVSKQEKITALETKSATDEQTINSITAEKDQNAQTLNKVTTALDELGETVQKAETPEAKVEAVRHIIASKPSASATGAQTQKDVIETENKDGVDWATIDSLPHNKDVD
jgi:ATP-dependent protease ClpP protease subunit